MYFSTYFSLFLWGDVAIFLFWFGWGFVELVDIAAYVFHDATWTPVKPQWRLFKAFGGGRGRIQSNLVRIQLDLSFRVVFSRICGGRIQSDLGRIQLDWGRIQMGLRVKFQSRRWTFSMQVLRNPMAYWKGSMGALVRVNGGIGQGQWGYWKGSIGGVGQGQWWHWSGSMGVLKRVNWRRWSGSMVALVRGQWGYWKGSIGGVGQGQWWHWSGSMGVLKRVNWRRWSGSMGVLKRVNGGIEKGQ